MDTVVPSISYFEPMQIIVALSFGALCSVLYYLNHKDPKDSGNKDSDANSRYRTFFVFIIVAAVSFSSSVIALYGTESASANMPFVQGLNPPF